MWAAEAAADFVPDPGWGGPCPLRLAGARPSANRDAARAAAAVPAGGAGGAGAGAVGAGEAGGDAWGLLLEDLPGGGGGGGGRGGNARGGVCGGGAGDSVAGGGARWASPALFAEAAAELAGAEALGWGGAMAAEKFTEEESAWAVV